jgi:hypothetical protein
MRRRENVAAATMTVRMDIINPDLRVWLALMVIVVQRI